LRLHDYVQETEARPIDNKIKMYTHSTLDYIVGGANQFVGEVGKVAQLAANNPSVRIQARIPQEGALFIGIEMPLPWDQRTGWRFNKEKEHLTMLEFRAAKFDMSCRLLTADHQVEFSEKHGLGVGEARRRDACDPFPASHTKG
jgi:hypothetical protein